MARFSDLSRRAFLVAGCWLTICVPVAYTGLAPRFPSASTRLRADQLRRSLTQADELSQARPTFQNSLRELYRRITIAECLDDLRRRYPSLPLARFSSERLETVHATATRLATSDRERVLLTVQEERYQSALDFAFAEERRPPIP
jgi:hypothetical protein